MAQVIHRQQDAAAHLRKENESKLKAAIDRLVFLSGQRQKQQGTGLGTLEMRWTDGAVKSWRVFDSTRRQPATPDCACDLDEIIKELFVVSGDWFAEKRWGVMAVSVVWVRGEAVECWLEKSETYGPQ